MLPVRRFEGGASASPFYTGAFSTNGTDRGRVGRRVHANKLTSFAKFLISKGIDPYSWQYSNIHSSFVTRMNWLAIEYPEHYAVWRTLKRLGIGKIV